MQVVIVGVRCFVKVRIEHLSDRTQHNTGIPVCSVHNSNSVVEQRPIDVTSFFGQCLILHTIFGFTDAHILRKRIPMFKERCNIYRNML